MQIVKLPTVLPGDLDLQGINAQLFAGKAQLDWSRVESAPRSALEILLSGLELDEHADILGIGDGISDDLDRLLVHYFESRPRTKPTAIQTKSKIQKAPQLWRKETEIAVSAQEPTVPSEEPSVAKLPVLVAPDKYEIRAELEREILLDLHGPAGGLQEEVDEQRLSDRYLVGMLAPLVRKHRQEEQEEELASGQEDTAEEGTTEGGLPPAKTMFPSSFGLTFCVCGTASAIAIKAGWGQYTRGNSETLKTETGRAKTVWKREQIAKQLGPIALVEGALGPWVVHPDYPQVLVQGLARAQGENWIVSLFLVNGQTEPDRSGEEAWLFQAYLQVQSGSPERPDIFVKRLEPRTLGKLDAAQFAEERAMSMLYRNHVEFAAGHGVGVHADVSAKSSQWATKIGTKVVPSYEVPKTSPPTAEEIPDLEGLVLDMRSLADLDNPSALQPLTTAYANWIQSQRFRIDQPEEHLQAYRDTAQSVMSDCEATLQRVQAGIDLLATNAQAQDAFRFMNQAMAEQRLHALFAQEVRRGGKGKIEDFDIPKNRRWYPFQLAFILLNLPAITDIQHPERSHPTEAFADLLWFPTGGGKTEAYLGLAAYTIALRRLQGVVGGRSGEQGVAVLMRYTLRLLTLQQFQRATTLICACELIRRENPAKWGNEPFRIGLWVGLKTTPNTTEQAAEVIAQGKGQYQNAGSGTPHQLTNCPWCGTVIDPGRHIRPEPKKERTFICCGDGYGRCPFSKGEGLPILVVDLEIYRRLPALLIATVDKFAQMPWKGEVQMLFGRVDSYCPRHGFRSPEIEDTDSHKKNGDMPSVKTESCLQLRPPDLIIQDELHLISGPLGTMVGLYETAIDALSAWEVDGKRIRPKVVASTATIRQAQDQVYNLFLRKVSVFPPQGLDVGDNFFSRTRTPSPETPGRLYLGICAPGRRLKAALIRVYSALLSAAQLLYKTRGYGSEADPWMTLVGYFNSMRELGGARRIVDDDVRSRLLQMEQRGLAKRYLNESSVEELTSRRSSTEIPQVLDRLEARFDPTAPASRNRPLDVLLATNMISVGVDVSRLGAMVVAGQPKGTAEYIQATSRVGRSHPGLVITVFNWSRPRDLSHYERFEHYHATFYQQVESLSVTPFSAGAVDRGLAALLISMVRLTGIEFNQNGQAGRIHRQHPYVQSALREIVDRATAIDGETTGQYVQQELERKIDDWLDQAQNAVSGSVLGYQKKRDGLTVGLLRQPDQERWQAFTCLNSLRNVEPTVALVLDDSQLTDDLHRRPQPMPAGDAPS